LWPPAMGGDKPRPYGTWGCPPSVGFVRIMTKSQPLLLTRQNLHTEAQLGWWSPIGPGGVLAGKAKFLAAGLLIVVAAGYLIVRNTGSTAHYFITIEELEAMGEEALGRDLTVSGAVLGSTIEYDASLPRVTFTMVQVPADPQEVERAGGLAAVLHAAIEDPMAARLEVVFDDIKPDLLQHEAQVICRGRLGPDGRFYAEEVLLKCPARYAGELPTQAEGQ